MTVHEVIAEGARALAALDRAEATGDKQAAVEAVRWLAACWVVADLLGATPADIVAARQTAA